SPGLRPPARIPAGLLRWGGGKVRSRLTQQLAWGEAAPAVAVAAVAEAEAAAEAATLQPQGFVAPLTPRDNAIFLLRIAAEIEHALLVQYLYAFFSLRTSGLTPEQEQLVAEWQGALFTIAQQEMAHLATVQNLLRFLGAALS